MNIGFLFPTLFASKKLFGDRIFAPAGLARDTVNELIDRGHRVHVFSTPDFETRGILHAGDIAPIMHKLPYHKLSRVDADQEAIRTDEVYKRSFGIDVVTMAYEFAKKDHIDIMHSYHDFLFTPHYVEDLTGIPTVYTLHDPLPPDDSFEMHQFTRFAHHAYVSISNAQRQTSQRLHFVDTVYHGLDASTWSYVPKHHGYLLFMGRLVKEKGLRMAIDTAIQSDTPLYIGANFPPNFDGDAYFEDEIKPFIDHPLIHEPGMTRGKSLQQLYGDAASLLFPIEWEEPFGMVMIEAMACGTPVIAFGRGSVPEIVKDGVTGFIVRPEDGVEGLVAAVKRIGEIDRAACRKHVEQNFSLARMAQGYERVYKTVIDKHR